MTAYGITSPIQVGSAVGLAEQAASLRPGRVLLVSSPTVAGLPRFMELRSALASRHQLDVYAAVEPDAPISLLEDVCIRFAKPDLIVGVGGGSVIDSVKALSICWQDRALRDIFHGRSELPQSKTPVFAVPTTAGTGAELSFGAILFDAEEGVKGGIRGPILQPDAIFIDVDLYKSAPGKLIAETGFDCLTHAIETHVSHRSSPLARYQSVAAARTVLDRLGSAVTGSEQALGEMALASCMMGANLAFSSTCLPHRLQYVVGPLRRTSHAVGLVALYRGWLPEISQTDAFGKLAAGLGTDATTLVGRINGLKRDLDIDYRAGELGLDASNVPELVARVSGTLDADPCYRSRDTLTTILMNSI